MDEAPKNDFTDHIINLSEKKLIRPILERKSYKEIGKDIALSEDI